MFQEWLSFSYRDFYDVPRAIVVWLQDAAYYLYCPFDSSSDDYSVFYKVYLLDVEGAMLSSGQSWIGLEKHGNLVGEVLVSEVEFDESKRRRLRLTALQYNLLQLPGA